MKKLFFCATLLSLVACGSKTAYDLKGTISAEKDGQYIYLQKIDENGGLVSIDSALVSNGAFQFKGEAPEPEVAYLFIQDQKINRLPMILESGKMKVDFSDPTMISGTAANDSLQQYFTGLNAIHQKLKDLREQYLQARDKNELTPEKEQQLNADYEALDQEQKAYTTAFIEHNLNSLAGTFVLSSYLYQYSLSEIDGFLENATPAFKSGSLNDHINKYVDGLRHSEVGAMYTNLTMSDLEGKEISLSDYVGKGKYVLVDFWASWCGPCRREMPYVVEAYKEYAPKGFEIVAVSFDNNKEAWEKGVKELGITWPQMSDLKGWNSAASEVYGIRSIPSTLLLDPEGKIIAKDLRGEELTKTLSEYLK